MSEHLKLTSFSCSVLISVLILKENNINNKNNFFSSPTWCVCLTVFVKTSKLTNYCWMLCEGLYLYKLIVYAFKEQTRIVS